MRFIMIDRICHLERGTHAIGIKSICAGDPFLTTVFPGTPVFSPVVLAESAAQLISWIIIEARDFTVKPVIALVDHFVCSGHTVPGDRLVLEGTIDTLSEESALAHARITCDGRTILQLQHAVCYLYPLEELDPPDRARSQFANLYLEGSPLPDYGSGEKRLPYRPEVSLQRRTGIDALIPVQDSDTLVGIKNITASEPYFNDHFPRKPVAPGVIICEGMTGLAGLLLLREAERLELHGRVPVLQRCDKMKFRRFVVPGDQLTITAKLVAHDHAECTLALTASAQGLTAATARLSYTLMHKPDYRKKFLEFGE